MNTNRQMIRASLVAFVLGAGSLGAHANPVGVGDSPDYPSTTAQLSAPFPGGPAHAQAEPDMILMGDAFVPNPAYRASAEGRSRADVRAETDRARAARRSGHASPYYQGQSS